MFEAVVGEEVLLVQAEGGQQVAEEPQLLGHGVGLLAPVSHLGWPENGGSVITIPYYEANMFFGTTERKCKMPSKQRCLLVFVPTQKISDTL